VGVLPGGTEPLTAYTVVTGYRIVTNGRGGFFEAAVKAGDRVRPGAELGTIRDAYGDVVETLTAPEGTEIVLGVSTYPVAPTGGWLLELGTGLTQVSSTGGNAAPLGSVEVKLEQVGKTLSLRRRAARDPGSVSVRRDAGMGAGEGTSGGLARRRGLRLRFDPARRLLCLVA
jgi:hypothetical protein